MNIINEIISYSPKIRKEYKEKIILKLSRKQAEEGGDRRFFNQYWQPFAWAATIGFLDGKPLPIEGDSDDDVFKYSVINNQAPDILKSLIVMAIAQFDEEIKDNKKYLSDPSLIIKIINEYANRGFKIITKKLEDNPDYFYEHNIFITDLLDR
ncbi:MAG TPA: hypothetical protein DD434_04840 [Bacteroidales bacterium]|nr:hypothetical protein [Bacteroidales bacterium]